MSLNGFMAPRFFGVDDVSGGREIQEVMSERDGRVPRRPRCQRGLAQRLQQLEVVVPDVVLHVVPEVHCEDGGL